MGGELVDSDYLDGIGKMYDEWRRKPKGDVPGSRPPDRSLPPIRRGILLGTLQNGASVKMALTTLTTPPPNGTDPFGFKITILGNPIFTVTPAPSFTLTFVPPSGGAGQTTNAIPALATAAQVQSALAALPGVGTAAGNVSVSLGSGGTKDGPDGYPAGVTPGVWLVRFGGKFLQGQNPRSPGLSGTPSFSGISALTVAAETWLDVGGNYPEVTTGIPVGNPTPMNSGCVVLADFMPGVGLVVQSVEPRFFAES